MKEYKLKELEAMPTIHHGHTDDLKVEEFDEGGRPFIRLWLSRLTKEDGMMNNNEVTVEERIEKGHYGDYWKIVKQYSAK